jgi:hypothetical protein
MKNGINFWNGFNCIRLDFNDDLCVESVNNFYFRICDFLISPKFFLLKEGTLLWRLLRELCSCNEVRA